MKANNPDVHSMDAVLDKLYGSVGTPERDEFRKEAAAYCVGQIISDARKHEGMTRHRKIGTDKTYIRCGLFISTGLFSGKFLNAL